MDFENFEQMDFLVNEIFVANINQVVVKKVIVVNEEIIDSLLIVIRIVNVSN